MRSIEENACRRGIMSIYRAAPMGNFRTWVPVTKLCNDLADAKESLRSHIDRRHGVETDCAWAENEGNQNVEKICRDTLEHMAERERELFLEVLRLVLIESAVKDALNDPDICTSPRQIFCRALGTLRPQRDMERKVLNLAEELSEKIIERFYVRNTEPAAMAVVQARKQISQLITEIA